MSIAVDTNILVRYLTWDDAAQAEAAAAAIEGADSVTVSTIVLCELAWVLKRAYRYGGQEIADAIQQIIESRNVELDRPAATIGLRMLRDGGDFADGVIQSDASRARCRYIVTFDQEFARLAGPGHCVLLGTEPSSGSVLHPPRIHALRRGFPAGRRRHRPRLCPHVPRASSHREHLMPLYECVLIARNDVTQQQVEGVADDIATQLEAEGGAVQEARILGPARPGLPDQEEPQGPLHAARPRRQAGLHQRNGAPARPERGHPALHDHPRRRRSRKPRRPSCRASRTTASAASAVRSRPGGSTAAAVVASTIARSSAPATSSARNSASDAEE